MRDELVRLFDLVKESDSIELKVTVPERAYRSTTTALGVDPLEAQIRQVFFFDTSPSWPLDPGGRRRTGAAGAVARDDIGDQAPARGPTELPAAVRRSPNFVVEVDAMPGGYVVLGVR